MRSFTPRRLIGAALALALTFLFFHVFLYDAGSNLHYTHLRRLNTFQGTGRSHGETLQEQIDRINRAATDSGKQAPVKPRDDRAIVTLSNRDEYKYKHWIKDHFPDWDVFIYLTDESRTDFTIANNKGREATAYLTYIVENYDSIPETVVFIHGKAYDWHNDDPMYATAPTIRNLRLDHVQEKGYVSLRCAWDPGCPATFIPGHRNASEEDDELTQRKYKIQNLYADAFESFFPGRSLPAKVGYPCCSQFAVSRAQILKRSRGDYEMYLKWMQEADGASLMVSEVMEKMWHIIFGQPADMCNNNAKKCYCDVFGHCDLECPEQGKCSGRYWPIPEEGKQLPDGWPHSGQGEDGFPQKDWWKDYPPFTKEDEGT